MDCVAELCAHECCFTGEGKWASGLCCCCQSFDANGCADAACCAFAVSCTTWKHLNIDESNWNKGDTCCDVHPPSDHQGFLNDDTCFTCLCCPCPWVYGGCGCVSEDCQKNSILSSMFNHLGYSQYGRKRLKEKLGIRPTLSDWMIALCCLPWCNFL